MRQLLLLMLRLSLVGLLGWSLGGGRLGLSGVGLGVVLIGPRVVLVLALGGENGG